MDVANKGARLASAESEALAALSIAAVKGGALDSLPDGVDLKRLFRLAKTNYIIGIVYPAIKRLSVKLPPDCEAMWRNEASKHAAYLLIQNRQRAELKALLEKAELRFVGLKGYIIGKLYPEDTVRSCADIDIAVPSEERKRIRRLLTENGYTEAER